MDAVCALARLLSDPTLREQFLANRQSVAWELCPDEADAAVLLAVEAAGLRRQADLLIAKRTRAVFALIPNSLSGRHRLFVEWAGSYWPEGYRRHELDAWSFLTEVNRRGLRYCVIEYLRLHARLSPTSSLVRFGLARTGRGWRPGLAVHAGWSGRRVSCVLTLG
jgi:hypothetical protein